MSSLAELQQALDLYGSAMYWRTVAANSASTSLPDAEAMADALRQRAVAAGCSTEQIDDADSYAARCAADHRKPLTAEVSFDVFGRVNGFDSGWRV